MLSHKLIKFLAAIKSSVAFFLMPLVLLSAAILAYAEDALPLANKETLVNKQAEVTQPTEVTQQTEKLAAKKNEEQNPSFNVFEFQIDGNTVLSKGKLEEAVYAYLGEAKTIDDVEKARAALEKTYQDAGYLTVSVSIPQQEVNAGLVTLQVTEGSVEKLRIKDSQYSSLAEIKSRVTEFEEGKVPNFTVAQQQLNTVNRGQNRQVTPVLRPGKSPGKVEVDLKVQDKLPLHGNLELNNQYSADTTETRLNGSLRYENLWQKDHSISLSFQVSPESTDEVKVFAATYLIPRLNGDYFAAYGVISDSNVATLGDVSVVGKGNIFGTRYIYTLPLLENYYHSTTFGADYKDFQEGVIQGFENFQTPITYTSFLLGYDGTYQGNASQTQFNMGFNFSVRGLGNSDEEFANKRFLASPDYAYIRTDIKHTQKLPYDWSLMARLSSQLASEPLISAEQFTIGGADSVRGYLESTALGDSGLFTSLELRTPQFKKYFSDSIKDLYALAFIDYGQVNIEEPLPGQEENGNLLSVGLGVNYKGFNGIFSQLDYAHTLKNTETGNIQKGDDRLLYSVGYEW